MSDIFKKTFEKVNKPDNFKKDDPNFAPFVGLEGVETPPAQILEFKNVRVSSNLIVRQGLKFLAEPLHIRKSPDHYKKLGKRLKHILKYIFPHKSPFGDKPHLMIANDWSTNYYHWHLETLGKLTVFHEKGLIKDSIIVLLKKYKNIEFMQETLKAFGVRQDQILYIPKKSNMKIKKLLVVKCATNKKAKVEKTREILFKYYDKKFKEKKESGSVYKNLGEKVYIARVRPYERNITNEKDVHKLLQKYGYKKVLMEKESYLDQVSIGRNAKVITGPHGAGITNSFFMDEGSCVFEYFTNNEMIPITDFCRIASMGNMHYLYQCCNAVGGDGSGGFGGSDMFVDLKKLEENLKLIDKIIKKKK